VSAVVRRLPRRVVLALGRMLGRLWCALDARHRAIAADNLRRAFPEWDEERVQATARGVYAHFATVLLDILWMEGRPVGELLALADVEGLEHMTAALARGGGLISPLAHIGNWEFQGVATASLIGPVAVVARPLDNPALDRRLVSFRASTGNIVIYKQRALPQVLQNLHAGRAVGIVVDQNVQAKDGIFVQFFGRPASTTTVAAALALKTGCPIVPARCVLRGDGRYRMVYGPPVEWSGSGRRGDDVARLTQDIASIIEGWVRETPEQWLWLHRRWKTCPSRGAGVVVGAEGSLPVPSDLSEPGQKGVPQDD
jgi:KDO2-lipid IV(A) lauroyltransferase